MHDIEDYDPLQDIFLSDEEVEIKTELQSPLFDFSKKTPYESSDNRSKENKQKVIAELFRTNHKSNLEKNSSNLTSIKKSEWLDLKDDLNFENQTIVETGRQDEHLQIHTDENTQNDSKFKEKNVHFGESFAADRRKSESNSRSTVKKSKSFFKSLDLDSDLNLDSRIIKSKDDTHFEDSEKINDIREVGSKMRSSYEKTFSDSSYTPSSGLNKRSEVSRKSKPVFSAEIEPEYRKFFSTDLNKESLPSWLDLKNENNSVADHSLKKAGKETVPETLNEVSVQNDCLTRDSKFSDEGNVISFNENIVTAVMELKQKQEEFKKMTLMHNQTLSEHERIIENSVINLINQQRNSISALMQIISSDNLFSSYENRINDIQTKQVNNTTFELQTQLADLQLEKSKFEIKLQLAERKYEVDLSTLEDTYKCKLQLAEEKEFYLRKEIKSLEEDFNEKILKLKQNETELINIHKEKVKILQEEQLKEMKHISEIQDLKLSLCKCNGNQDTKNTSFTNKELTIREEIAGDKQRQLIEFQEYLNKENAILEGKKASLETRIEEFETKQSKERLNFEQQQKEFKLARRIFEEKEISWERDRQREREYLSNYKQEIELFKENLLKEETKLMKEKFEIEIRKARLEAIVSTEANSSGRINDFIQNQAELKAKMEDVRLLKSKLEKEKIAIKTEQLRLREENWRLRDIEQQLKLQNGYFQKLFRESERKREEGMEALRNARKIESQMNEKLENIEKRICELNQKEEQLNNEKIAISKERDLINKKRYQLDLILPQLTYEEQLPFNLLHKNFMDPKILLMKLKTESDISSVLQN